MKNKQHSFLSAIFSRVHSTEHLSRECSHQVFISQLISNAYKLSCSSTQHIDAVEDRTIDVCIQEPRFHCCFQYAHYESPQSSVFSKLLQKSNRKPPQISASRWADKRQTSITTKIVAQQITAKKQSRILSHAPDNLCLNACTTVRVTSTGRLQYSTAVQ